MTLPNEKHLANIILSLVGSAKVVAFACSGGVDSMFLTVFASSFLGKLGIKCIAIIVDHRLREDSTTHAKITQDNLAKYSVESVILTWGHEPISSAIEEKARKARYELIMSYCKQNGIAKVFLAHHVDDKIETFLMNAMRGSGLDGLLSMQERVLMQGVEYLRPMIFSMEKKDIITYMQKNQIPWVEDESNQDAKFTRNNIRQMLNLTQEQKRGILVAIKNLESIQSEYNVQVDEFFQGVAVHNFTVILPSQVYALTKEVFFRVVKRTFECVYPLVVMEIRRQNIERLYKWLASSHSKATLGNCVFEKTLNCVKVYPEYHKLEILPMEAGMKKNWNNIMEITCNSDCSIMPLGLVGGSPRKMFEIKEPFLAVAHLPVFMHGKKILAIPHLGILTDAEFECSV